MKSRTRLTCRCHFNFSHLQKRVSLLTRNRISFCDVCPIGFDLVIRSINIPIATSIASQWKQNMCVNKSCNIRVSNMTSVSGLIYTIRRLAHVSVTSPCRRRRRDGRRWCSLKLKGSRGIDKFAWRKANGMHDLWRCSSRRSTKEVWYNLPGSRLPAEYFSEYSQRRLL